MNTGSSKKSSVLAWAIHVTFVIACLAGLAWTATHPEVVLYQSKAKFSEGWTPPTWMVIPSLIAVALTSFAPLRPSLGLIFSIAIGYGFPRRESYEFFCRWHVTEALAFLSVTALVAASLRSQTARGEVIASAPSGRKLAYFLANPLAIAIQVLMVWVLVSASVAYVEGQYRPVSNHNLSQMFTATCLWMVAAFCLNSAAAWYWIGIVLGLTLSIRTLVAPQYIHLEGDMGVLQSISIPLTVLAFAIGRSWPAKIAVVPVLGFQILTLLRTENRGGLLALAIALLIGWLLCKQRWRLLLFAAPVVIAFGFAFASSNYRDRFEAIWRGGPDRGSVDSRFVVYEACWNMFLANPIFGVGLGNSEPRMAEYSDVGKSDSPHSNVMGMLAEAGALGATSYLLFFVGSIAIVFWQAYRTPSSALHWVALCLGASLIAYQISGMFMTRHTLELAYMLAGGVIALRRWQLDVSQGEPQTNAAI